MDYSERLSEILNTYKINVEQDLQVRWNTWEKDMTVPELYEVVGGLMSRQVTIALNFLSCSSIWNGHIAPIIMRSMVDNYINFAWVLEDSIERARRFIYYGLGQEKLNLEHRKEELKHRDAEDNEKLIIEASEQWINTQRFGFLTEVSLKSWSEVSVRKMAEEANCLDLYNYVYQPFSSAAHNMWNHVAKYNLVESDNPLHKSFRRPGIYKFPPDVHYAELAAKYVNKMFDLFDKKFGYETERNSFQILQKSLDDFESRLYEELNKEDVTKDETSV